MNTDRPISALSHTVETADMSLYDLTSAITPAQSGYALMLAKNLFWLAYTTKSRYQYI